VGAYISWRLDKVEDNFIQRNPQQSLIGLLQKSFSSIFQKQILKVRMQDDGKYYAVLNKLTKYLNSIEVEIRRLREEGMNIPETTLNIDAGTSEEIKNLEDGISALNDQISQFPDELKRIDQTIKDKDMVVNVPPQPKIEFPKLQQISGKVDINNQISLDNLIAKVEEVAKAVKSIYIPPQAKVEIPKFPEIKIPPFPSKIKTEEGKQILEALAKLESAIKNIFIPETVIPESISISNFPPQKIPTPVTNISINPLRGYFETTVVSVGTSITALPQTPLVNRRSMFVYNSSTSKTLYLGGSSVTTSNGIPVPPESYSPPFDAGPKMQLFGVTTSGTLSVRVMEMSNDNSGG